MTNTKDFDWESWTRLFHDTYEELAPSYSYLTQVETRTFDPDSPNGKLMKEVVEKVIGEVLKADRQQLLKAVEEMKEELPTILWKDEHEPNLIKRVKNHTLDQVLDLLKAKDYMEGDL